MSQTMDLKVEHTNKLAQENEALRAQVEVLLCALDELHDLASKCDGWESFPQKALDKAHCAIMKTPDQCLFEIKAQGIMEALSYAKEKCSTYLDVDFYVMEYANLLTESAQGGE